VNLDTAIAQSYLNQYDQQSPYGNVTYTPTGETMQVGTGANQRTLNRYSQNVQLAPSQQRQLDLTNQLSENALGVGNTAFGNVASQLSSPFDPQGLAPLTNDFSGDRQRIEDSLYNRQASRLDDQFGRGQQDLETSLINKGFQQGSEGYTNAMKDFNFGKNDAYQGARTSAIGTAGEEQARMNQMNLGNRQQGFSEASYARSLPINELASLLGFSGGVQTPQFSAPPQTGVANTTIPQQQGKDYSGLNALLGLGGQLGSAFLMSDARVKENIVQVGNLENGLGVYSFNFIGDETPQIGLMAQEVEKIKPHAVKEIDGIKHVNYAEAIQ
jgi:hypothetical protein